MSMWRLSWITFVFLPLTFITGFFGMNVDTFNDHPSISWYFISGTPLMILVFISWFVLKNDIERSRQTPYSQGIYEQLFHKLAVSFPLLWSRTGPRQDVMPDGRIRRIKWWLILRWSREEKTIKSGPSDGNDQFDGLGTWSRIKRDLTKRWTAQLNAQGLHPDVGAYDSGRGEAIMAGLQDVNAILKLPHIVEQSHANEIEIGNGGRMARQHMVLGSMSSPGGRGESVSVGRPSTALSRNSAVIVDINDVDLSGDEV
jgi:hypothetical protein